MKFKKNLLDIMRGNLYGGKRNGKRIYHLQNFLW